MNSPASPYPSPSLASILSFACLAVLLLVVQLYGNPFPYSDDWALLPQAVGAKPVTLEWLWTQHTDHRIPIHKLLEVLLLRVGGFNASVLILFNVLLLYLATVFVVRSIQRHRGGPHIGDCVLPLILLNPGFAFSLWGFYFTFVSSTVLLLLFVGFALRGSGPRPQEHFWVWAAACLALLPFCGTNGVIPAAIISAMLLGFVLWARPFAKSSHAISVAALLTFALVASMIVVATWKPSDAAEASKEFRDMAGLANAALHLVTPRPLTLPFSKLYYVATCALYLAAGLLLATSAWASLRDKRPPSLMNVALGLALCASFALLACITWGRSGNWKAGQEVHYGYLATVLPVTSWLAVAAYAPRKASVATGLTLVILFGYLYASNIPIRFAFGREQQRQAVEIYGDLAKGATPRALAETHVEHFYFVDTEESRRSVEDGLVLLRDAGIAPYTRLKDE